MVKVNAKNKSSESGSDEEAEAVSSKAVCPVLPGVVADCERQEQVLRVGLGRGGVGRLLEQVLRVGGRRLLKSGMIQKGPCRGEENSLWIWGCGRVCLAVAALPCFPDLSFLQKTRKDAPDNAQ